MKVFITGKINDCLVLRFSSYIAIFSVVVKHMFCFSK